MNTNSKIVAHFDSGPQHRIIRINNESLATQVSPGQKLQIDGPALPVMRCNPQAGWLECLYPTDTHRSLAEKGTGESIEVDLGNGEYFTLPSESQSVILIGEGLGLAPILFLSLSLPKEQNQMVLLGTHDNFPFRPHPSHIVLPSFSGNIIATMPLLEERKIPCRLAHSQDAPGCFDGSVIELAKMWLEKRAEDDLRTIRIYASSDDPDLEKQVEELAAAYGLIHQYISMAN